MCINHKLSPALAPWLSDHASNCRFCHHASNCGFCPLCIQLWILPPNHELPSQH
jgi:hypothetical protein